MQRIEHGEVALTRHTEDSIDAMRGETIDEQVGGTAWHSGKTLVLGDGGGR
jgi:hypothetical protein